ncbi:MAG: hypothetical protein ACK4FL_00685 [Microgenomates group bacterium]
MPKIIAVKPDTIFFRFTDGDVSNAPIFHDAKIFLEFVDKNRPKLTSISKNLTRKDIYLLNQKLQYPDDLDLIVDGKVVRKLQNETEASTLHFLKNLCQIATFIKKQKNRLTITKLGKEYLTKPSLLFFTLWQVWLFYYNWVYLTFAFEEKVVEFFQKEFSFLALLFLEQADYWLSTEEFFARTLSLDPQEFSSTFERVVLKKLEYFGLIETKKIKDDFNFDKIVSFKLSPLGEKVFKTTFHVASPKQVD